MNDRNSRPSRRPAAGVRASILAVGAVGIAAAAGVGALGMSALNAAGTTLDEVDALHDALSTVQDIETSNSDVTGWQASYAWDTRRIGGAAAVADDNANRAGFLDSAERLRGHLAAMHVDVLSEEEQATFATIQDQWDAYFEVDAQAVAAYSQNTPAALATGDDLVLGPGWDVYFEVFTLTGELRESLEARSDAAAVAAHAQQSRAQWAMGIAIALGVVATLVLALAVARRIVRPLQAVVAVADAVAAGDLTRSTGVVRSDEVGRVAAALDRAVVDLRAVMTSVVSSADAVAASSEELSASSAQISASAEETSAQSGVVSAAAEEVSRSVQTVAAGAEQMGASIREIASNAAEASQVATRAVDAAAATTATVAKLGDSSAEIGNVVKVITSIAEQTNLLALNATIEAARAGEAGKGFAVVANEVKELAQETAKATEDIARRVQAIQGDTGAAVAAIEEISSIVGQISDRQTTIASAVEEQTATTNEMSRSVQEAAGGTGQIADNITSVSSAAGATTQALTQTRVAVDELSRMAAELRTTVGRFTY